MDNNTIGKAFLHILYQIVYVLFILPYGIWCKAIKRLAAQRENKSLKFSEINSQWPMFTFLKRWFIDFLFDLFIAIIWFVGIYLYFKYEGYKSFKFDFGDGLKMTLYYLYGAYFSVAIISWLRDLFILGLKPLAKFFSWLKKPAQHLDITINRFEPEAPVEEFIEEPIEEEPAKLNHVYVIAGLAVISAILGLLSSSNFKSAFSRDSISIESVSESVSEISEEVPAPVEAEPEAPVMPDTYLYPAYNGNSIGEEMANLVTDDGFAGTMDGMTLQEQFEGWHASSMGRLKQAKGEDNGYLYQFFFNRDDGRLSGIALSHYVDEPWYECQTIDERLGTSDSNRMVTMPNGAMVSPGYTGGKVYIYYFYPCAPDPNPAPRR
ncbi:MAG: hypothetical protein J6X22_08100 [Muribaculaceae bacterium]|nr:hypothetical protein [Muribaculaceae bacterium]